MSHRKLPAPYIPEKIRKEAALRKSATAGIATSAGNQTLDLAQGFNPNIVFGFEFAKVDAEERLVEGWATADCRDLQGDRIPFGVSKLAFEKFAATIGIREMHQPKAIGKLVKWWADDANKRIGVQVYISKSRDGEDALTKVKEGILRGFSIGGRALDWAVEALERVIKEMSLTEISLVDVPANPVARITLVKVDDAESPVNKFDLPKIEGLPALDRIAGIENEPEPVDVKAERPNAPAAQGVKPLESVVAEVRAGQPAEPEKVTVNIEEITAAVTKNVLARMKGKQVVKQVGDAPNLRDAPAGTMQTPGPSCSNCAYFRWMGDGYCRMFDFKAQAGWVCDAWACVPGPEADASAASTGSATDGAAQAADAAVVTDPAATPAFLDEIEIADVAKLAERGSQVGIVRKAGAPMAPPKGYPADWHQYGDPANWRWPADKKNAGVTRTLYNLGKSKDQYSAGEWALLGRRIARIASAATGGRFQFNAAQKRIDRADTKEKRNMGMAKADFDRFLEQVRGQVAAATDALESDPDKARDMLDQVSAAIDVASDTQGGSTSSVTKPSSTGSSTTKAASTTPDKTGGTTDSSGSTAGSSSSDSSSGSSSSDSSSSDSSSSSSSDSSSGSSSTDKTKPTASSTPGKDTPPAKESDTGMDTETSKALLDGLNKLNATVGSLVTDVAELKRGRDTQAPGAPGITKTLIPAGDVPAAGGSNKLTAVERAIVEGDLMKGLAAVGYDKALYDAAVDNMVKRSLAKQGIASKDFFVMDVPPQWEIE